jgi:hypothetical protein
MEIIGSILRIELGSGASSRYYLDDKRKIIVPILCYVDPESIGCTQSTDNNNKLENAQ